MVLGKNSSIIISLSRLKKPVIFSVFLWLKLSQPVQYIVLMCGFKCWGN